MQYMEENECANVGDVFIRIRNGAPSGKGCVANGQMTNASNKYVRRPPPPPPCMLPSLYETFQNDEKATKARGISPYGDDPVSAPTDFAKTPASAHQASASSPPSSWGGGMLGGFMAAAFFTVIGVAVGRWSARRGGYSSLSGPA